MVIECYSFICSIYVDHHYILCNAHVLSTCVGSTWYIYFFKYFFSICIIHNLRNHYCISDFSKVQLGCARNSRQFQLNTGISWKRRARFHIRTHDTTFDTTQGTNVIKFYVLVKIHDNIIENYEGVCIFFGKTICICEIKCPQRLQSPKTYFKR